MPPKIQHLRSTTANKRPDPALLADGQMAQNTAAVSPGAFIKLADGKVAKIGPTHVGTTAPNATPAAGGSAGNSVGEGWLDTSLNPPALKVWNGTAWVAAITPAAVPAASETVAGIAQVATQAEVDAGTINNEMVTPLKLRNATLGVLSKHSDVATTAPTAGQTLSWNGTAWAPATPAPAAPNATETVAGIAQVATQAEVNAGAIDTDMVTPLKLKNSTVLDSRYVNVTGDTMTGALAVPVGTAADPSLKVGSATVGLYQTTAGSLALANGGSGRIAVGSDGNVCIGPGEPVIGYRAIIGGTIKPVLNTSNGFLDAVGLYAGGTDDGTATALHGVIASVAPAARTSGTIDIVTHLEAKTSSSAWATTPVKQFGAYVRCYPLAQENYGMRSYMEPGSGKTVYNFYAEGSALNYFGGSTRLGQLTTDLPGAGNTTTGGAFQIGFNDAALLLSRQSVASLYLNCNQDGNVAAFSRGGVGVGTIYVSTTGTTYGTSSDYRLKENVTPLTNALERVMGLTPHRFNFIADPGKTVDGFLAHEVESVVPEAIAGEKDQVEDIGTLYEPDGTVVAENVPEPDPEQLIVYRSDTAGEGSKEAESGNRYWVKTGTRPVYQAIDQAKLVPLLTAALQEAVLRIEALEAKLAA